MSLLPITGSCITEKKGDLTFPNTKEKARIDTFLKNLPSGVMLEVSYEVVSTNVTRAQHNKLNKAIRELAKHTGCTFEEMKKEIKRRNGLFIPPNEYKSFAKQSKEDISFIIQSCVQIGDAVGLNLH